MIKEEKAHFLSTGEHHCIYKPCDQCPLRLGHKDYKYSGIGSTIKSRVIIVPNPNDDYLSILKEVFPKLLEDTYITPFIKCKLSDDIPITSDIIRKCIFNLKKEFMQYTITDMMLLGDAARYTFGITNITVALNKVIVARHLKRRCFVNYDPLIKYTDKAKFESFKSYLTKWIYATDTKIFDYDLHIL